MTSVSPRTLWVAGFAALLGAGLGLEIARSEPGFGSDLGIIIAALAGVGLAAAALTTSREETVAAPPVDELAWMDFRRELRRARRHGRPLTLVRIPLATDEDRDPDQLGSLARRIGARLRLIDRAWIDDGSIYLMLPETSRPAAQGALGRLDVDAASVGVARARFATFPDDGLTSGALIAAVHDVEMDQVPTPIRPATDDSIVFALDDEIFSGDVAAQR